MPYVARATAFLAVLIVLCLIGRAIGMTDAELSSRLIDLGFLSLVFGGVVLCMALYRRISLPVRHDHVLRRH
jgi:hypothetical protein